MGSAQTCRTQLFPTAPWPCLALTPVSPQWAPIQSLLLQRLLSMPDPRPISPLLRYVKANPHSSPAPPPPIHQARPLQAISGISVMARLRRNKTHPTPTALLEAKTSHSPWAWATVLAPALRPKASLWQLNLLPMQDRIKPSSMAPPHP